MNELYVVWIGLIMLMASNLFLKVVRIRQQRRIASKRGAQDWVDAGEALSLSELQAKARYQKALKASRAAGIFPPNPEWFQGEPEQPAHTHRGHISVFAAGEHVAWICTPDCWETLHMAGYADDGKTPHMLPEAVRNVAEFPRGPYTPRQTERSELSELLRKHNQAEFEAKADQFLKNLPTTYRKGYRHITASLLVPPNIVGQDDTDWQDDTEWPCVKCWKHNPNPASNFCPQCASALANPPGLLKATWTHEAKTAKGSTEIHQGKKADCRLCSPKRRRLTPKQPWSLTEGRAWDGTSLHYGKST